MAAVDDSMTRLMEESSMSDLVTHFAENPDERGRLSRIIDDTLNNKPEWLSNHPSFALKSITFISSLLRLSIMPRLVTVLKRSGVLTLSEPQIKKSLNSVLSTAGKIGDEGTVLALLDGGLSPQYSFGFGSQLRKLIHYAASNGFLQLMDRLFQQGVDINSNDVAMRTPLLLACQLKQPAAIRWLISKEAELQVADKNGYSVLHYAVESGNEELVFELLDRGINLDTKDHSGNTALHIAASFNHVDLAIKLIQRGLNPQEKNDNGASALISACEGGATEIALMLIDNGMDPNEIDSDGLTPLHIACGTGNVDLALALLGRNVEMDILDRKRRRTPLHIACQDNMEEVAMMMIYKGANASLFDSRGCTALHYACRSGHLHVAKKLIEKGLSFNHQDIAGRTPFRFACNGGHLDIVKMLLDAGADPLVGDNYNDTSLHYAIEEDQKTLAAFLINHTPLASLFVGNDDRIRPIDIALEPEHQWALDIIETRASANQMDLAEILHAYAENHFSGLEERLLLWLEKVENKEGLVIACSEHSKLIEQLVLGKDSPYKRMLANPEFAFDQLSTSMKLAMLPAFSPKQIKEVIDEVSDEIRSLMLAVEFEVSGAGTLPVLSLIHFLITEVGQQLGGNAALLSLYFKKIPAKYLALVANDPVLIPVARLLSPIEKRVVIPQWSAETFMNFVKDLDIDQQLEYLLIATEEQRLAFIDLVPEISPPAGVASWREITFPQILQAAQGLEKKFDEHTAIEADCELLNQLQSKLVREAGLARQYVHKWELVIVKLSDVYGGIDTDDETKQKIVEHIAALRGICVDARAKMHTLRQLLFHELDTKAQQLKGEEIFPDELLDPILATKMENPVICSDGSIFDRSTLVRLRWRSPYSRKPINPGSVVLLTDEQVIRIKKQGLDAIALEGVKTAEELRQRLEELGFGVR